MICINCGSNQVSRDGDNFTCAQCGYGWNVAHEQASAPYLRAQGREPATSIFGDSEEVTPGADQGSADTLDSMTVPELKDFAAENGIELVEATKKADIIAAITAAQDKE